MNESTLHMRQQHTAAPAQPLSPQGYGPLTLFKWRYRPGVSSFSAAEVGRLAFAKCVS
jgi:hypothetical protein